MLVNVNGIYYAHVCEQVHSAHSAGNSAIENLCINIYYYLVPKGAQMGGRIFDCQ